MTVLLPLYCFVYLNYFNWCYYYRCVVLFIWIVLIDAIITVVLFVYLHCFNWRYYYRCVVLFICIVLTCSVWSVVLFILVVLTICVRDVAFIWETGYWTRAIKRFALFDLLKSLYSDTNILSKYIPSLQKKL